MGRIHILSYPSIADSKYGKIFFTTMAREIPSLLPDRFDQIEPIKKIFNIEDLDKFLELWSSPDDFNERGDVIWKRTKTRSQGGFSEMVCYGKHDSIYLIYDKVDQNKLVKFFKDLIAPLNVQFSYIDDNSNNREDDPDYYDCYLAPFSGLFTPQLKEGLPGVTWGMYFGKPYVNLFGKERLLATPAFQVEEVADGVYIQLTKNIDDPNESDQAYNNYKKLKEEVVAHLDCDAFKKCAVNTITKSAKNIPDFGIPEYIPKSRRV